MASPTTSFNIKSFWQRPEGKTGLVVLLATVIAGLYGLSLALPWMIAFATDLIHLGILCAGLFVALYTVSNKTFRSLCSNFFQLSMRWMTGMVVEIDPIGILKNTLDRMRDNAAKLQTAIEGCNGAKKGLERQIATNDDTIRHATSLKEEAEKQAAKERDPLRIQRITLQRTAELQEIGRRMHSNEKLKAILAQTVKMYNMLTRWQDLADFNIQNTTAEIANAEQERKAIQESYRGLSFAKKLIAGDDEQMKMFNASLEYLAEDNARKLGAMEDFARYSEKYLSAMDLESGANAADAEKMLAQYEQQLLSAASPSQGIGGAAPVAQAIPVPRSANTMDGDYLDLSK